MDPEADEYRPYQFAPRYTPKELEERRRRRRQADLQPAATTTSNDNDEPADDVHGGAANAIIQVDAAIANPDPDNPDPEGRLDDIWWCQCQRCLHVPVNPNVKMCVCCQEQPFDGLTEKLDGPPQMQCITEHADFSAICLTAAVLEMMEAYTRERRGYGVNEEWTNRFVILKQ